MSKRILLLLILPIVFISSANAQKAVENIPNVDYEHWHWGYYFGASYYDFKLTPSSEGMSDDDKLLINTNSTLGISVGLIGGLRLNDYFSLKFEPGLNFSNRDLLYDESLTGIEFNRIKIRAAYLSLPLLVKFAGKRKKNIRPYLIGGGSYSFLFKKIQNDDDAEVPDKIDINKNEIFWEAGGGIDWYFPQFKLTTEIRGAFGINDLIKSGLPSYIDPIDKLQTRTIFFILKVR